MFIQLYCPIKFYGLFMEKLMNDNSWKKNLMTLASGKYDHPLRRNKNIFAFPKDV